MTSGSSVIELRQALLANKDDVESALQRAEAELVACQQRCAELGDVIERARLVLGLASDQAPDYRRDLTLHEAMVAVLRERTEPMTAPALATEINQRRLYRRRDGKPVDAGQIHARVGSYGALFARRDRRIALSAGSGS